MSAPNFSIPHPEGLTKSGRPVELPGVKGQNKNAKTPAEYLAALEEPRKSDVVALDALIRKTVPGLEPFLHAGMLAYGPFHYRYESGREGDWFKIGLASNARYISLYLCGADEHGYVAERYRETLPKANIGKSCVRFKKLADLDLKVLTALIVETERSAFGL